ncbi:MAG: hypothetical protein ACTH8P_00350 [Ewingella sp.]|uniref:hypothetical protein n=1 Tax=Ewingella TaxID=41201 RepID=UPI0033653C03
MTQLSRYRPNYVRHFIEQHPQGLCDVMSIHWQHEIRQTLLLGERACCESILCQPDALWLEESQHPANDEHTALSPWIQTLNQAALNLGTLPELDSAQKLYSIGVMISYASKRSGKEAKDCAEISRLPEELAQLASDRRLQEQYEELPIIPSVQLDFLRELNSLEIPWEKLPESPRKATFMLQLALMGNLGEAGESRLLEQIHDIWRQRGRPFFNQRRWMLNNYLLYRLYHDTFPQHETLPLAEVYFDLVADYFLLRSLLCLWMLDGSELDDQLVVDIFSLYHQWRQSNPITSQQIQALRSPSVEADLAAFALLVY